MTLESPAYVISADSHSAELFRRTAGTMLSGTGVVSPGDLQVQQNGSPNMSVNVPAGQVWVPGTLGSTSGMGANLNAQTAYGLPASFTSQGPYQAYQDAPASLAIAAADPTNPRIDLVVAYVEDAEYAGSSNQPVLGVITGTPAVSPSPPSAPASAVVLAQVAVAANATEILTANVTDVRPFMALPSSAPVGGRMYPTAQTIVASGTATQITSLVEDWAAGGVTVASNALTVPATGLYVLSAAIQWQANGGGVTTAGQFATLVYHNGAANYRQWWAYSAAGENPTSGGADVVRLAAGDTLTMYGYQASGNPEASAFTSYVTWLSAVLIATTGGAA